ncbi:MAG: HEAT repeat domain-containing protein [Gammaproteobacteria bacterium]|nr:HEAT repeat domain-containing protein [Gammaproteobacteria bacterium]
MKNAVVIGTLVAIIYAAPVVRACETLESCIDLYPAIAAEGRGIGKTEGDLARKVQSYGPDAIPYLIGLLEHESPDVRQLAGYTIRSVDGLGPEHLDPLIKARENGDGWIPLAIARIGTQEAIEFLANDLRERPQTHTQVTNAFDILGEKGAPLIAELFACIEDCNERVFDVASFVLAELGEDAVGVIPRLLAIAEDDQFMPASRQHAIVGIGQIGPSGEPYVPELLALRERVSFLASAVDYALLQVGSSEAVSSLLQALPNDAEYVLADIGRLGRNGYEAGPAVLAYLNDPNWDIRMAAAVTLGHIGYTPASSALANALTDVDDWKLVYAASLSLARLDADEFLESLELAKATHWYPPVRDIAASAIRHIESGKAIDEEGWWQISTVANAPETCEAVSYEAVDEPKGTKLYATSDREELENLSYQTAIYSYDAPEGTEPNENGKIEVTNENMVEHVEYVQQVPELALRVPSGWFVGADRGEWGGELVYIPTRGENVVLSEGNIEDIFPLGDQLVATSGLAHLFSNQGVLLRINEAGRSKYLVTPWKRLPAAPISSWLIEGGELLVNTNSGGSIIVNGDGIIRMAECVAE